VVFPWHFSYFTAGTLGQLLRESGFRPLALATRNLLLRRDDPYEALGRAAPPPPGPTARRAERWLSRAANPAFRLLDGLGVHLGAQLEVYAVRL
jgi:hypothetical protein